MKIKILSKDDTLKIISDEVFISTWGSLAKNTTHCTFIQEYGFVVSWYQSYLDKYKPMMVLGYDEEENIVGILPLALAYNTGDISHAGADQAEYHGWICLKEYEEEFLVQTLISIKKECIPGKWKWGWLPPKVNINWLHSKILKESGIYINSITSQLPLHNLENPDKLQKFNKNKSDRSKMNRLKREGELRIERIRDRDSAERLLEIVMTQYNFRFLSLYNHIPFQLDKNKRVWHLNQMDLMPENIHVTALWHGDELLACNFGFCTADKVLLGLISYDPLKGRHSPGRIFLITLLEFIKEEGYKYLDLTPGGDNYKEHFSNEHVTISKPTICFNRYNQINDFTSTSLRNLLKKRFTARDLASIQSLTQKSISDLIKSIVQQQRDSVPPYFSYRGEAEEVTHNNNLPPLQTQQYHDLLLYQNKEGILTPKEVAYTAMKKFERGDRLYTMVSGKELIAFVWLANSGKKHWHPHLEEKINQTENSIIIYDFYVSDQTRKDELFQYCMEQILKDIQNEKVSVIYLVKPENIDKITLNKAGFLSDNIE